MCVKDFAQAIHLVYSTPPDNVRDLRDIIVEYLATAESDLLDNPDIESAIESIDKLAYQLYKGFRTKVCSPEDDSEGTKKVVICCSCKRGSFRALGGWLGSCPCGNNTFVVSCNCPVS